MGSPENCNVTVVLDRSKNITRLFEASSIRDRCNTQHARALGWVAFGWLPITERRDLWKNSGPLLFLGDSKAVDRS